MLAKSALHRSSQMRSSCVENLGYQARTPISFSVAAAIILRTSIINIAIRSFAQISAKTISALVALFTWLMCRFDFQALKISSICQRQAYSFCTISLGACELDMFVAKRFQCACNISARLKGRFFSFDSFFSFFSLSSGVLWPQFELMIYFHC